MDKRIAEAQNRVLRVFAEEAVGFALAGGTALERYYLHHRFSWDLDFFSPVYDEAEIERLTTAFKKRVDPRLKLQAELTAGGRARVRFYSMPVRGASRPLKIDFVEDVLTRTPKVRRFEGVRVYDVDCLYRHKVAAIAGVHRELDEVGRTVQEGRNEPRDVFDLYMLSTKVAPLHRILADLSPLYQKGMIHWYRTFSRQDLKLGVLDLDRYDPTFDARDMISHLENEIRLFAKEVLGE
jgi:hypothetical protein